MHLFSSPDTLALAQAVKRLHHEHRFLAAVVDAGQTYHLFGSPVSCTDALIEALTERPLASRHGEYEYLDPHTLARIASARPQDPLAQALKNLGRIDTTRTLIT